MESDFKYEFYNAGHRIQESMRFSISSSSAGFNADGNDTQSIGYWTLDARKEDFFFVPSEIASGNEILRVNFAQDIKRRFGKQGVVLIDPKHNPEKEDPEEVVSKYPVAPDREAAVARGEAIWLLHLRKIVEGHLADCQNAMAAGGAPRATAGFTKKAFKLLGIADPGEQYFLGLKETGKAAGLSGTNDILLAMQQQQTAMMAIVLAVASGEKIDPELLKALIPKAGAIPIGPIASGVATGEIRKPVGEFDPKKAGLDGKAVEVKPGQVGLDAYDRHSKGKSERAKNAERALAGD
jgi:hypothetical protein